ncbi:MAG: ABC transporter ATP-binding protein [Pseudomonadota bacterium]
MSPSSPLLKLSGIEAGYGEISVLWGVDLTLPRGEISALVGSNGAGKSTLMRTLSGLIVPTAGRIDWEGEDLRGLSPAQILAHGIAHVPEGRRLFSAMSVEENLLMGAYSRKDPRAAIQRGLDRVYATFRRLHERRRQAAGTLSGGEQQMCAIGRGMMSAPRLLIIDELSLGLSPLLVEQLVDALQTLNREGLSILVVEQDVITALELSTTAHVMDMGRIVQSGPSSELMRDPAIRSAYLGALAA